MIASITPNVFTFLALMLAATILTIAVSLLVRYITAHFSD